MRSVFFSPLLTITIVIVLSFFNCSDKKHQTEKEPYQNTHPVWSPDGNKIAFISNRIGVANDNPINFEVYTINANGEDEKRHTFNKDFEADLSWSANGNQLVFKSFRDKNDEIYIVDLSNNHQLNISNHTKREGGPFWSKKKNLIYFQSQRDHDKGELYTYDVSTKDIKRLTNNDFSENNAVWSADETQIAFVSNKDGDDDIYLMNSNGENLRQLTNKTLNDWYPQWSPDSKSILYTYGDWNSDIWELRIINVDGTGDQSLIKEVDSGNASWHPDGKKIAFASGKSGKGEVYVYDLETKKETQITQ